jgi:CRISPR-associated endonuclease/helicase Cas3
MWPKGWQGLNTHSAYFAHSADGGDWQLLSEHLRGVAELAQDRAAKFGAGEWGRVAGLLHDFGKSSSAFQARLRGSGRAIDHSTAGAVEACRRWLQLARPLQFVVAGHHTGLADGAGEATSRRIPLSVRLRARPEDYSSYLQEIELPANSPPLGLVPHGDRRGRVDRAGFPRWRLRVIYVVIRWG